MLLQGELTRSLMDRGQEWEEMMQESVVKYEQDGFTEIKTDSGSGSRVLVHDSRHRAVKIQEHPSYDRFVAFVRRANDKHLPVIYSHEKPLGDLLTADSIPSFSEARPYTVTELELLERLDEADSHSWESWIATVYDTLRAKMSLADVPDDPFSLKQTFDALRIEAVRGNVGLDVSKATNVMIRRDGDEVTYVFLDPFHE
jgi:hypothetical protein